MFYGCLGASRHLYACKKTECRMVACYPQVSSLPFSMLMRGNGRSVTTCSACACAVQPVPSVCQVSWYNCHDTALLQFCAVIDELGMV